MKMESFHFRNHDFIVRRYHSESDYEAFLVPKLCEMLPDYHILPFKTGVFSSHDYGVRRADLVFIHKEYKRWIVVEVELSHHSLDSHVYPQAYTFRNGEYKQKHVNYLLGKCSHLVSDELEFLMIYNPPEVLVIVDDPSVYDRNWGRLNEVCKIAIGVPFRDQNSEYGLHYNGWLPKEEMSISNAIWNKEACFLSITSPSLIFDSIIERCELLIDERPSNWVIGQIRGSVLLYPINQWVKQILNQSEEYSLVKNSQGEYELITSE